MAHFYGTIHGARGMATRIGNKLSGMRTVAASWDGAIAVTLTHDKASGLNAYSIDQIPWHGAGRYQAIARGIVGATSGRTFTETELSAALRRAKEAHSAYEKETGKPDENWPDWYAHYMMMAEA